MHCVAFILHSTGRFSQTIYSEFCFPPKRESQNEFQVMVELVEIYLILVLFFIWLGMTTLSITLHRETNRNHSLQTAWSWIYSELYNFFSYLNNSFYYQIFLMNCEKFTVLGTKGRITKLILHCAEYSQLLPEGSPP